MKRTFILFLFITVFVTSVFSQKRIALLHDGNAHDNDDIGALAMALAIVKSGESQGLAELVHCSFNNHHWANHSPSKGFTAKSQYNAMTATGQQGLSELFSSRGGMFFNARTRFPASVAHLANEIDASGPGNLLYICTGGPQDQLSRALRAASLNKIQYVRIISHSKWNNKHSDAVNNIATHNMNDIKGFLNNLGLWGKCYTKAGTVNNPGWQVGNIINQNDEIWHKKSAKADFAWMNGNNNFKLDWVYSRILASKEWDVSDAGMVYWVITGNQAPNWSHVKNFFSGICVETENISNLGASLNGCNVELSWTDVDNEGAYRVRRKEAGGNYTVLTDIAANSTSYTDNTTEPGKSYVYMVRPFNDCGFKTSNEVNITIPIDCDGGGGDYIFIDHNSSGKRLKATDANTVVTQVGGTDGYSLWEQQTANGEWFYLVNKATGQKLKSDDGTIVFLAEPTWTGNKVQWRWVDAGNGWYRLENRKHVTWLHVKPDGVSDLKLGPTSWTGNNTKWKYTAAPKSINSESYIELSVYPNPATSLLNVELTNVSEDARMELYNSTGQIVKVATLENAHGSISLSGLNKGIYVLQIHTAQQKFVDRVIVE